MPHNESYYYAAYAVATGIYAAYAVLLLVRWRRVKDRLPGKGE